MVTLSVATINAFLLGVVTITLKRNVTAMIFAKNTTKITLNVAMGIVSLKLTIATLLLTLAML